jgi:hypothetical protein
VGIVDTADKVENITDSASHAAHSRDHTVANTPNIAATVNTADTVDTELSNMDRSSRDHMPAREGRGRPRERKPAE